MQDKDNATFLLNFSNKWDKCSNTNLTLEIYKPFNCSREEFTDATIFRYYLNSFDDITEVSLPYNSLLFSFATMYNFAVKFERCITSSNGLRNCSEKKNAKLVYTGNFIVLQT